METLYQLPSLSEGMTKTQIKIAAESSVSDLLENGNILAAAEAISVMEAFIKEVKGDKRYTDYVRDEIAKNGKAITNSSGAKLELAETGTKYDYSNTNDFVLPDLLLELATIEAHIKQRQDFLKSIPSEGIQMLDPKTGEMVNLYAPSKISTSSYKVTLSK